MLNWMTKEKNIIFAVGAVTGAVLCSVLKTKKVRKFAVKTLAKGMMLKDNVSEEVCNIREEADDICNEAKAMAKNACECDEGCECGEDCECESAKNE